MPTEQARGAVGERRELLANRISKAMAELGLAYPLIGVKEGDAHRMIAEGFETMKRKMDELRRERDHFKEIAMDNT